MDLRGVQVTWLGHGTFKLRTAEGKVLLIDPWVQNNPACPDDQKQVGKLDAIAITHGHFDHIGDIFEVVKQGQPEQILGVFEMSVWLESKGVEHTTGMNKGGSFDLGWVRATMTHADHSCGIQDGDKIIYGGEAVGYVFQFPNGLRLYAAGDTNVFSSMQIIGELYHPQVAILPIGDFYTMGPREAAYAAKLTGVEAVIPVHYGTFPALDGSPAALREALGALGLGSVEVADIRPGQTIG